jgi:predicted DNA-binding transcriptional regulator YafY
VRTAHTVESDGHLADMVRRLRSGDALTELSRRLPPVAAQVPGVTSAATMEILRKAVREARRVLLGYAEQDGTTSQHTLRPISLAGGVVRGYEDGHPGLAGYAVHRLTAVILADDDEDDDDPA